MNKPKKTDENRYHKIGIQAEQLGGSFHEIALREYWFKTGKENLLEKGVFDQIVIPYKNHNALMEALRSGLVSHVITAVDNPYSGRVESSIVELAENKEFSIHAAIGIRIEQRELCHLNVAPHDAIELHSQKPALDQVRGYRPSLIRREQEDTLGSAILLAQGKGYINGVPSVAVASAEAGEKAGLKVGNIISEPDNMTHFWFISHEAVDTSKDGEFVSLKMKIGNGDDDLLEAVEVLSEKHNLDLYDIDCHLNGQPDENDDSIEFFLTFKRQEEQSVEEILNDLSGSTLAHNLMGIYDDYSEKIEHAAKSNELDTSPTDRTHRTWLNRSGVEFSDEQSIVYVQGGNEPKSFLGMLRAMKGLRKVNMSRPIVPEGNGARGFYFVMDSSVSGKDVDKAINEMNEQGYAAEVLSKDRFELAS